MDKVSLAVLLAVCASTGVAVFAINVYNIPYQKFKKSDYVEKQRLFFKYSMVCLFKGCIYGTYAPFSLFVMLLNSRDKDAFDRHIIPCSVYFKDDEKND